MPSPSPSRNLLAGIGVVVAAFLVLAPTLVSAGKGDFTGDCAGYCNRGFPPGGGGGSGPGNPQPPPPTAGGNPPETPPEDVPAPEAGADDDAAQGSGGDTGPGGSPPGAPSGDDEGAPLETGSAPESDDGPETPEEALAAEVSDDIGSAFLESFGRTRAIGLALGVVALVGAVLVALRARK